MPAIGFLDDMDQYQSLNQQQKYKEEQILKDIANMKRNLNENLEQLKHQNTFAENSLCQTLGEQSFKSVKVHCSHSKQSECTEFFQSSDSLNKIIKLQSWIRKKFL